MIEYIPTGICPKKITFCLEGDVVKDVTFYSGCHGNLQAISKLIDGLSIHEVVDKLKGIKCGSKGTSCPDQLAIAIENAIALRKS